MTAKIFFVPDYGYYVYDGLTNRIITIGPNLTNRTGEIVLEKDILSEFVNNGLIRGVPFDSINWRESLDYIKNKYESGLESLILQVTRDCNLRCSYCAYSGKYRHMLPHAKIEMSIETIRRSIDFFMEHSSKSSKITILFYGGEPLLEYKNLKMAVEYADHFGRQVRYGITSNGTVLSPEIVRWLYEHPNVYLTITLNGPKHDDDRRTVDGKGSLRTILDNISYVKEVYPTVWENQIRFISNIASSLELLKLREFYRQEIHKQPIMVTNICFDNCTDERLTLLKKNRIAEAKAAERMQMEYLQTNDLFLKVLYDEKISFIHNRGICGEKEPGLLNSCLPMSWRLFVRTDGTFNMCEKVSDSLSLGNLQEGFREETIKELYLQMKAFAMRNCRNCWAQRMCMYCYQDIIDETGKCIDRFAPEWCRRSRQGILNYLRLYVKAAKLCPEKLYEL